FTLHFILSISQGIRGHRYVLPFPTRRSSDLAKVTDSIPISEGDKWILLDVTLTDVDGSDYSIDEFAILYGDFILLDDEDNIYYRSEEHTSELQSRENLVCRLLLVKKTYV